MFPPGSLSTFVTYERFASERRPFAQGLIMLLANSGTLGRGSASFLRSISHRKHENSLLMEAATQAHAHGAELVWVVLDSPISIRLASRLAKHLCLPLVTTVWDDISHLTRYFKLDRLAARYLQTCFAKALSSSRACAVIGESMQDLYEHRYGVKCVVVRHGLPNNFRPLVCQQTQENEAFRIGFAGSVTAQSAFNSLLKALDLLGWEIEGRPICLRLLGLRFVLQSCTARRIEVLGYQSSVAKAVDLLAECSLNYLPQPFEPDWMPFAKYSFPTKLTTYLAAGVPLLLHTPTYGSLHQFFDRYPFGVRVNSLDSTEIASALKDSLMSPVVLSKARAQIQRAFYEEFTADRFHAAFQELIEMPAIAR